MPNEINPSDPIADETLIPPAAPVQSAGVKRRLILSTGATALGPVVSLILQLVNVPVFLHYWGPELYGEWLLLSAIPAYLGMSDMGFGTVAGNEMSMLAARGDYEGALETFQSTWQLISIVSVSITAVAVPLICFLPVARWLHLSQISLPDARWVLVILAVDSLLCLQSSLPVSAYRAAGLNHIALLGLNIMRLVEGVGILVLVASGRGPLAVAWLLIISRGLGNSVFIATALRLIPWLRFGLKHARWSKVRELVKPAVAFMAFPAANALNLQGTVLAIGLILGPAAVAMFTPLRTVARVALQLTETLKNGTWPEFSAAYGARNFALARKLHRLICQLALVFSGGTAICLGIVGPWLLHVWTHNRISIDLPTFYFLLAGVAVNALWNTSSTVPIAANQHTRIAMEQLIAAAVSLLLAVALMHPMHLVGAALGLMLGDVVMIFTVVPASNRLLHDDMRDFITSLFNLRALSNRLLKRRATA